MTWRANRRRGAILVALACAIAPAVAAPQTRPPAKKNPLLKLVEPWPDDDWLRTRRADADARPLFADAAPLAFTLTADFAVINRDRNPSSAKRYPATLTVGATALPVRLGTRGHFRL